MSDRLAGLAADKRRLLEMRLRMARDAATGGGDASAIRARPRPDGVAPLSFAQHRQWVLEQLQPGTSTWNVQGALRIRGALDVAALGRALDALRERHESLRTVFARRGGQPVQRVRPFAPVPLAAEPVADFAEAERIAVAEFAKGFDLSAEPPFRVRLLRAAADGHVLVMTLHHVICDGWSMGIVSRELAALYGAFAAGAPDPLDPPELQYADYAAWQREWLSGERLRGEVEFWRRALAAAPPALEMPLDHPRPPVQSHRGGRVMAGVEADETERLRALAAAENTTLFAVLAAAWRGVLARWSGQDDVVLGTAVAGRTRVETEGIVGLFVNTLALRTPLGGDPTFRALLRRERDTVLDAFAHQELPFERVVEELKAPRDPARAPVCQALLTLQNASGGGFTLPGLETEGIGLDPAVSKLDLAVEAHEQEGGIVIVLDYDAALFRPSTARALVDHLRHVLRRAGERPDASISTLAAADGPRGAPEPARITGAFGTEDPRSGGDGDGDAAPVLAQVLDEVGRPLPLGVPGELWVRGDDGEMRPAGERARWTEADDGAPVIALVRPPAARDGDSPASARPHEPPSTADEELLAAIWAEVLGLRRVGAGDDFFEQGGHSLLAAQVATRVEAVFGVEIPLRTLFDTPVLRDQARRIAALRGGAADGGEAIPHADGSGPLPLSFAQERLWFITQLVPGSPAYNVPFALAIDGPLDVPALERALGEIVRRHEPLRTVFAHRGDAAEQVVLPFEGFALPIIDLSAVPADERDAEVERHLDEEARAPFDLAAGPVFRARLLRLGRDEHVLSMCIHHIATDLWSGSVLHRELRVLYDAFRVARPSPLPGLPLRYADFAAWQRAWLGGGALERQTEYWRRRLAGVPALLEIPADRPRPPVQDLSGTLMAFALPADAAALARTLARREGATLFMVLLAAFQALLHRWTGEEDVVVGTPIANRTRPELEGLIGFFDNTLALRGDLSGDPTFTDLLRRVRETTLEAYAHQDVPFEKLVDELKVPRSVSHTPLFQVMLTLQNAPDGAQDDALGETHLRSRATETSTSRFDLTLILSEREDGGVEGWAEYATALFDESTVRRLTRQLGTLLREAATAPAAPLSTLALLSATERAEVVHAPNATARPRPPATVHALVSASAARTPRAVAIEHAGERVTYAGLEARANRLAHRLRRMGVGPDVRVAVAMERSPGLVVTTLAVIRAGGCCVPVDPAYPAERVAYMLADSRAAVVVTTSAVAARLPATDTAVLAIDAERDAIAAEPADDPGVPVDPDNLLYVLYTSGSTGRPKGAALPHRALANLLRWQVERWGDGDPEENRAVETAATTTRSLPSQTTGAGVAEEQGRATGGGDAEVRGGVGDPEENRAVETAATTTRSLPSQTTGAGGAEGLGRATGGGDADRAGGAGDGDAMGMRTLQFASLSFDVSFQEIYGTWMSGGTLVLIDDETRRDPNALLAYLRRERIGRLFLPFAALQSLAEAAESGDAHLPDLREVITAGEALRSTPQLRAFFRANPRARLENQYGPSETHVVSAHALADDVSAWDALPPIGAPVDNTRLYVLDRRLNAAPLGVPGELYAAGDNLARGYLARPALTAERFVPDPFGPPGSRLYRTGDRARWRRRAELEYLGRTDFQVKIRGFRVEPGEVESALAEHPAVAQAAVAVRGEGAARRLAAYVVPAAGADADTAALRAYLAGRLPEHMVPTAWRVMDALPLTPSGKIDRRSLPEPSPERRADAVPRSAAERTVARVWANVLGVETVGADDNFFEIGGHSLLLARVRQGLRDAIGYDVAMLDLFQFSTVRTLAAHLDAARRADLPPAQADPSSPEQPPAAPLAEAAARAGLDRAALRRELLRRGKR